MWLCLAGVTVQAKPQRLTLTENDLDMTSSHVSHDKCGTPVILRHQRELRLKGITPQDFDLPSYGSFTISPSGLFKICYETEGPHAVPMSYVAAVARIADEAYQYQVGTLGYRRPPFTNQDSVYYIFIRDMDTLQLPGLDRPRVYGLTAPLNGGRMPAAPSGLSRVRTFLIIDNDFAEDYYKTRGLAATRITIFHEFHHVIQFGAYGERGGDSYFQEMTSTWMEMLADANADDYIQYIPQYISAIDLRFDRPTGGGYGQSIWLEYLASRYDASVIRNTWEAYYSTVADPLIAQEIALSEVGSSFCREYSRFGAALFFTGHRTVVGSPFADAHKFQIGTLKTRHVAVNSPQSFDALPASLNLLATGFGRDTVVLSIARDTATRLNGRVEEATIHSPSSYTVKYNNASLFCDTLAGAGGVAGAVFPQPFVATAHEESEVFILAAEHRKPVNARLDIFSTSMIHLATIEHEPVPRSGNYFLTWNGRDGAGKAVPSGVYLYVMEVDGQERSGKLVLVRSN